MRYTYTNFGAGKTAKDFEMAKRNFFLSALVIALVFGLSLGSCDTTTNGGGFIPVTDIADVPTIAIKGTPLQLSGTTVPSNATNKTIVWTGAGVTISNGLLTAASAGSLTVTAIVANGASESSHYTQNFDITVYDAGDSNDPNPFGNTTPYIWAMDDTKGKVYVTVTNNSWAATADGTAYNSGTYVRIGGIAARWTVTGGSSKGNTGLAVIESGKMIVANFTNEHSVMNGTFTKLDTGLTLEGTWQTEEFLEDGSSKPKIVAVNGGTFYMTDGSTRQGIRGTYPTGTNPAKCTITEVNLGTYKGSPIDEWVVWDTLTQPQKNFFGGSKTPTMIIYNDRCEGMGLVFKKQP
jgi:hypothetical protein